MASRKAQALIKAARTGDVAARLTLGRLYLAGGEGLAASPQAAFHWLAQALAGGSAEAAQEIAAGIPPEAASADAETCARAAAPPLEGLADHARPWPEEARRRQEAALAEITAAHPALAARLRLAASFDLDARETLFLDPREADQGWCLLADVSKHFTYKPWRLVHIETDAQRAALAQLRTAFADSANAEADFDGTTRSRMRALESLLRRLALDPGLFIRGWRAPWTERDQPLRV